MLHEGKIWIGSCENGSPVYLLPSMANRHGLIAGATGTGKTVSLKVLAEGACPGVILHARRGTGGFGYDPLFLYTPMNKTYAEMNAEEKNGISHRSRAAEKMREIMREMQDSSAETRG